MIGFTAAIANEAITGASLWQQLYFAPYAYLSAYLLVVEAAQLNRAFGSPTKGVSSNIPCLCRCTTETCMLQICCICILDPHSRAWLNSSSLSSVCCSTLCHVIHELTPPHAHRRCCNADCLWTEDSTSVTCLLMSWVVSVGVLCRYWALYQICRNYQRQVCICSGSLAGQCLVCTAHVYACMLMFGNAY